MLLWRVDYFGKVLSTLGTISASDEKSANRQGRSGVSHYASASEQAGRH